MRLMQEPRRPIMCGATSAQQEGDAVSVSGRFNAIAGVRPTDRSIRNDFLLRTPM